MNNGELKYTNLILKELSGDISDEEKSMLKSWLNENQEAGDFYKSVCDSWNSSDKIKSEKTYDELFSLESPEIEFQEEKKTKILPWILRVAAIFIVVFSILYLNKHSNTEYTIVNNGDEVMVDSLIDGTKVWLNTNSEIFVEDNFGEKTRNVRIKGDVYFDVVSNREIPFYVITELAKVRVVGTEFQVSYNPDDDNVEVIVESGKVSFFNDENAYSGGSFKTDLVAGEKAGYSSVSDEMIKQKQENGNYLFWKTGEIIFNSTPISEVIRELNMVYKSQIYSSFLDSDRFRLSAKFVGKDINEIVNGINQELGKKFNLDKESLLQIREI